MHCIYKIPVLCAVFLLFNSLQLHVVIIINLAIVPTSQIHNLNLIIVILTKCSILYAKTRTKETPFIAKPTINLRFKKYLVFPNFLHDLAVDIRSYTLQFKTVLVPDANKLHKYNKRMNTACNF